MCGCVQPDKQLGADLVSPHRFAQEVIDAFSQEGDDPGEFQQGTQKGELLPFSDIYTVV